MVTVFGIFLSLVITSVFISIFIRDFFILIVLSLLLLLALMIRIMQLLQGIHDKYVGENKTYSERIIEKRQNE